MTPIAPWIEPTVLTDPTHATTIRLEPLERRHAADLHAVADPALFAHSMQAPDEWSVAGFEREIDKVCGLPGTAAFAMVLAAGPEQGRAIGRSTYMDVRAEHRGLEIGRTWIGRRWHGTRVNPEAKFLMLRHAFECLAPPAVRVQLTTNITNLHSQAAIAKLGALREGVLRKFRIMPPALERRETLVRDWVVFSIVDDEWPDVKTRLQARLAR
jgi:N-acetyltransferase